MSSRSEAILTFTRLALSGVVESSWDQYGSLVFERCGDRSKRFTVHPNEFEAHSYVDFAAYLERLLARIRVSLFGVAPVVPLPRKAPGIVRIRMAERAREARRRRAA